MEPTAQSDPVTETETTSPALTFAQLSRTLDEMSETYLRAASVMLHQFITVLPPALEQGWQAFVLQPFKMDYGAVASQEVVPLPPLERCEDPDCPACRKRAAAARAGTRTIQFSSAEPLRARRGAGRTVPRRSSEMSSIR